MKKSVLTLSMMTGALVLTTGAAAFDDEMQRVSDEDVVRGFAKTCLASFPNAKHFTKRIATPDWGFHRVDDTASDGREAWQSKEALVIYNHRERDKAETGTPFCSYTALTKDAADPERVSALVQSALDQYHGMSVQRLAGPGQYGWLWGSESETRGFGRYSNIYLIYDYSDRDSRQITLSLQVRKER